ncbi:MAG TPA: AAA family ATPase [Stellaceae bacterium]|nr:AAA family ATPase [Stellaceae bacterium]
MGDTPNLAARLQALAEPGQVVISHSTRRLTGGLFEYRDLGRITLKGLVDPTQAWQVVGASTVESRFEAQHGAVLTPLVGREEELELLLRRWRQAKAGEGSIVLVSGEPGIGKSRIVEALFERLGTEPYTRVRLFCSPHHQDAALYPTISQLERAAGFRREDTDEQRLDKLEAVLARATNDLSEAAPLLAELLSVPTEDRYRALDLTPQKRKEKTFKALIAQVAGLAGQQPVVMVCEDAHWIDPTSLELLDLIVDRVPSLPMLLIITFRPEFTPRWVGRSQVTLLSLNRLSQRQRVEMLSRLTGGKALPREIADQIVDRTDGVPLFIEELTKAVVERDELADAGDHYTVTRSLSPLAIPTTLHASLLARLDRLAPVREVAQIGAALGRQFSHELISAVAPMPQKQLDDGLAQLVSAELVFRRGTPPDAGYTFKHALVQDAAYGTLLREPRRALHARIAGILESRFPEIAESQPELVARHDTEAGLMEKALSLWGKAGQRSIERSALVEAIAQLTRALEQIATLPATQALRREEIKLQVALIAPLFHVKGYSAPEPKRAVERARRLIEEAEALGEFPEDPLLLFLVLHGLWAANIVAFNGDVVRQLATEFLVLAERDGTTAPLLLAHRVIGPSLLCTGDISGGRAHLDRAIELYDPAEHRPLARRFGEDQKVAILCWRSHALWALGYPKDALADADHALRDAREIDQAATLMFALAFTSVIHLLCGNFAEATAQVDELATLADRKGAVLWKAVATTTSGCVLARTGKAQEGVHLITSGTAAARSMEATLWKPYFDCHLASAYAQLERFDEAWRCVSQAKAHVATAKERRWEAEVNRIAGEIVLASLPQDVAGAEAETYFERALSVAREQRAKSWELRAAMSMARLWRDQGKRTQAHNLLAPVYGWFTEGFDTPDLKEAKALLEELG